MADLTPRKVFEEIIPERMKENPDLAKSINATYKFVVTGEGGGTWVVDLTKEPPEVREEDTDANCTITIAAEDFVAMLEGKLDGQMAFMTGKLKIAGDMSLAMKLGQILKRG